MTSNRRRNKSNGFIAIDYALIAIVSILIVIAIGASSLVIWVVATL